MAKTDRDILHMYQEQGMSVRSIVLNSKIPQNRIYYILKKNHITLKRDNDICVELLKELKREYKTKSLKQLSIKYNIERNHLYRALNTDEISPITKQTILCYHKTGALPSDIAQKLNLKTKSVKVIVEEYKKENPVAERILAKVGLTKNDIHAIRLDMLKNEL